MVKLYSSLLALTLSTSLALAAPLDYSDRDLLERDLLDASDDLEARAPSFFGRLENAAKDVGKVVDKGYHVAESVASNPLVQTAETFIPGGAEAVAAEKVFGALGKVKKLEKVVKIAEKVKHATRKVEHRGGAKKAVRHAKEVHKVAKKVHKAAPAHKSEHHTAEHRRHRRDLEDVEELSLRDLDAEELFGREYDDLLVERDFFDDLD